MLRAARSATADHVRILLQQLLFFHRVKITAMRLQHQLEETMDDLDEIGFDGQVLNSILRAAHLELCSFIARCDHAIHNLYLIVVPIRVTGLLVGVSKPPLMMHRLIQTVLR